MRQKIKTIIKEATNGLLTILAAAISSLTLHVFVFTANFAPLGVDGIATMLQEVTKVNAGYFALLINIPLLAVAWVILKKKYVIYTVLFTLVSSGILFLLEDIAFFQYQATNEGLIPAVFSGLLLGVRTGIMLKIGASSGGVDIIACLIQTKKPFKNIETLISIICYTIILSSFFVYKDLNCILLSIVQMFVFNKSVEYLLNDKRNAIEFKIVTKSPERLKDDILLNLKHGATVVESSGFFTGNKSSIIFTVVNTRQIADFLNILKKYPDTFVYYTKVAGVQGNFRWYKDDAVK